MAALMESAEKVMRGLAEWGFATNMEMRGIWRGTAPRDFWFDFTAIRRAIGRPSVANSLRD